MASLCLSLHQTLNPLAAPRARPLTLSFPRSAVSFRPSTRPRSANLTTRASYTPTPATERVISIAAYALPFFNALQYGRFLFAQYPRLGLLVEPIFPILNLYRSVPYASFVAFFGLFLGVVRNTSLYGYTAFFPKNLTCSSPSTASRFESLSVSSIGSGSIRGLADSQRKVRSMATTASETGTDEKKRVEIYDLEENLAVDLAKFTAHLSEKFCKERGAFTVVVSGGSLIKSLRKLVEPPYVDSIDWSRWHFFWVDERVVPKSHDDSNYKLAYDSFLSKVPIPPGNVYAINESLSAEAAADDYETCLKHLVKTNILRVSESTGIPKFDLMLLGMGPDGHVASLFPGHGLCNENKKWVTSLSDSPKPPSERITFTFPVINSSAHIALVVCGSGKAEAVQAALKKTRNVPAGSVSAEDELVWFLDKPACSKL